MENGSTSMPDYIDLEALHFDQSLKLIDNGGSHCLSSFIDTGSETSHRYYLARRTLLEMLRDRGYDAPVQDISLSLAEFREKYTENPSLDELRINLALRSDPFKRILVIFCAPEVLKLKTVRDIFTQIGQSRNLNGLMLIVQAKITPQAKQALKLCKVKTEWFQITDLLTNITKHVLMPKHEILSKAEKAELLENYKVNEKQIPRMLETDAIAQYYGLEKGQVVKVTIDGDITGKHVTYRCVI